MDIQTILSEIKFKAVRSSGAGGQNVNKVSSKVMLTFDLQNSKGFSVEEKMLLDANLNNRLTAEKVLILNCDEDRSQLKNKETVTKRFLAIVKQGLFVPKERKPTKIPKSVIRKRIKDKKNVSEVKLNRRKPDF
jgi:ribosome-associated protein